MSNHSDCRTLKKLWIRKSGGSNPLDPGCEKSRRIMTMGEFMGIEKEIRERGHELFTTNNG
jgi:hypothetical protein